MIFLLTRADNAAYDNPGRAYEDVVMGEWPAFLDAFDEGIKYTFQLQAQERAAAETRVAFCDAANAVIYGEKKWSQALPNREIRDCLDPDNGAPLLYQDSKISLNFHAGQMITACNQRVFDVPAAGGFVLSDYRQDMARLFADDEYVTFDNVYEMRSTIAYYLAHEDKRKELTARARAKILAQHTYDHRAKQILERLDGSRTAPTGE